MNLSTPTILYGTVAAAAMKARCLALHQCYQKAFQESVVLSVLRLGDNPASTVYVGRKKAVASALGFEFCELFFPQGTSRDTVLKALRETVAKSHGVIVQLPIVPAEDALVYLSAIPWNKDVDGLNPLVISPMTPCTPLGCWFLLRHYGIELEGKRCVIVGRSSLVGRPLAKILLDHHATVTVAHSRTPDLASVTRTAEILFVAAGVQHLITPEYVQGKAMVVDVGIHRTEGGLTGDVHPDVYACVQAYTPVPGGVGPMTVITLMWNTLKAAFLQRGVVLSEEDLGESVLRA